MYEQLTLRNIDYIPNELQEKIRNTTILIAGCGIGSMFAEVAVRLGFENFILADGDVVSDHNLNRQCFVADDIGELKVKALSVRLKSISPSVKIKEFTEYISEKNVAEVVNDADIVFDTIDFLDLTAIIGLHDECAKQKKHLITALALGFGAGCIYFPPNATCSFRQILSLPLEGPVDQFGYPEIFAGFIYRLKEQLDPTVLDAISKALIFMEDGTPCPASQVAPGAYAVASFIGTLVVRILSGLPVLNAPNLMLIDMQKSLTSNALNLLE
ncbi:ThiF family adenylyltransferase [Clostridium sp.]|uniref:ThiF family adenylyltransferase n=1 Tax=Clostridium sp. TaxID=1506 RepID=UPI001A43E476|nr:ThiF family adenylyltransferase [Clostridium sp.]MBK5243062.1 ThiF family adenylyltransferase [Clostridium sp.]